MENRDISIINDLCVKHGGEAPAEIVKLPGAGSSRRYYRARYGDGRSVIATIGTSLKENEAFMALSQHFCRHGLDVPQVLAVAGDGMAYLQSDFGDVSLFDALAASRAAGEWSAGDVALLEVTVRSLAALQFAGAADMDFGKCYPSPVMDRRQVMWDLYYFKYCYLKAAAGEVDEMRLEADFDTLADVILSAGVPSGFMYRDFQSRNVMVHDGRPCFIDFQGGRRGPCLYDIVSFLWQARAAYPAGLRSHLLDIYFDELKKRAGCDGKAIRQYLPDFILFRTLQVLGAYGFRGFVERKPHFLRSIDPALGNLAELLAEHDFGHLPYLREVLGEVIAKKRAQQPQQRTTLRVKVASFSYRVGYPEDLSGNGGGFVFDCRAVTNPGKYDRYKPLTGLDAPVIEFIESTDEMARFLDNAYALVSASIRKYQKRGFTDLSVAFGCTGGRHRSVYAAQHMAERINRELGVEVELCHRERGITALLPAK